MQDALRDLNVVRTQESSCRDQQRGDNGGAGSALMFIMHSDPTNTQQQRRNVPSSPLTSNPTPIYEYGVRSLDRINGIVSHTSRADLFARKRVVHLHTQISMLLKCVPHPTPKDHPFRQQGSSTSSLG